MIEQCSPGAAFARDIGQRRDWLFSERQNKLYIHVGYPDNQGSDRMRKKRLDTDGAIGSKT